MMHYRVTFKDALEAGRAPTKEVPSVHKPAVHLVLNEGHKNARSNEPANNLQNKHQVFLGYLSVSDRLSIHGLM